MNDRQLFETLTDAVPGLVWVSDEQGRVEFNTSQWEQFTGMPQEAGLGHGWLDAIHPADAAAFKAQLPLSPTIVENVQAEIRVRRRDGVYHRHILNVRQVELGKWVGCAIDVHDWLAAELRDTTQGHILEMVVQGAPLENVLAELCKAAEKQIPGSTCSILLVDSSTGRFTSGVAPGLPPALLINLPLVKIGTGVGSCGTAAFEKRDVISADILTDPLWDSWRDLVSPLGFRACWSKPVFASDGDVIASFGFYFREPRAPSPLEQQELTRLRGLAALSIERARVLDALRESEEHYRYTVEQNPQIPWTSDAQGRILSVSSRWTELTGISSDEALGNGWLHALHPDDIGPTMENWDEALSTGQPVDIKYRIRRVDGQYRWARARATPRRSADGKIIRWYGTVEDIHKQQLASEKLRRQAYQDELTGLPNRRSFVDELQKRLKKSTSPVGLMVLDMDDFKLINDRYGHLTGDAILRLFARYLQNIVAPTEFVARLGGDEFAVICANASDEACLLERAKSVEAQLDKYMKGNKKSRGSRPSIGCTLGTNGESPDEVFKRADLALYAAKSSGKGNAKLFDPSIRSAASRRADALELARIALREDWIEAFFQPIVCLGTQQLRGFEALLRIRHPQRGLLSPIDIQDALEEPRLADAIGIRMATLVIENLSRCRASGISCGQVSLNLSTENLVNSEYLDILLKLMEQQNVPREAVKFEITERVLMDDQDEAVLRNLTRMRDLGFGLSLDDFGTGYASLVHLRTLPVTEIKIDRSFVSGLGTEANKGEIVQAMIGLAKTLGLTTVAEGIETQGEALKLTAWGCDYGQGFLFARPMPFEEAKASFIERTHGLRSVVDTNRRAGHRRSLQ